MAEDTHREHWKWKDPDPQKEAGILLSDRIRYYVEKVKLIEPFDPDSLRPASYNLHVGDLYFLGEKPQYPNRRKYIKIPRNGLIYVRLQETLNLPYYIVAQHDLRVKQVYRGFLAGRSLQIDPGYSGHINYPIYNFTNEDKIIHVGDPITSICFVKTTSFGTKKFWSNTDLDASPLDMTDLQVKGIDGHECLYFAEPGDRSIPEYWLDYPGESHRSSVEDLQRKLQRWMTASKWTAIAVVATLIAGIIPVIIGHAWWMSDKVIDLDREVSSISSSLEQLRGQMDEGQESRPQERETIAVPVEEQVQLEEAEATPPPVNEGS
ncbi:MAG: hypothetical protein JSW27_00270 [Phycisphaerales bacterium]|nr:MAG: hypothetical protein JSW27_00270 [Phycisphaerales bacterium]